MTVKLNRPPFATIVWYFLLLFTSTFLRETAFFNYDPSFLKLHRYCLLWQLSQQVTSYSAPSSLCILTVHTQHATSMANSTSIRHSPPDARSIFIPCFICVLHVFYIYVLQNSQTIKPACIANGWNIIPNSFRQTSKFGRIPLKHLSI